MEAHQFDFVNGKIPYFGTWLPDQHTHILTNLLPLGLISFDGGLTIYSNPRFTTEPNMLYHIQENWSLPESEKKISIIIYTIMMNNSSSSSSSLKFKGKRKNQ
nr:hypothetical protein [Microctonus hyperodae filamentous virus]